MINHTGLLAFLARHYKLESYLEIGVFHPSINFDKIPCRFKIGVDPSEKAKATYCMTSDEFFTFNKLKFDLIFIDGLHHAEQVKKDFENALMILNDGGFIVLHDCNPAAEKYTHIPRDNKIWCGDVYKFASRMAAFYYNIGFFTVDFDHGCMVVYKDGEFQGLSKQDKITPEITWKEFSENRSQLLNLIHPNDILNHLPNAGSYSKEHGPVQNTL